MSVPCQTVMRREENLHLDDVLIRGTAFERIEINILPSVGVMFRD